MLQSMRTLPQTPLYNTGYHRYRIYVTVYADTTINSVILYWLSLVQNMSPSVRRLPANTITICADITDKRCCTLTSMQTFHTYAVIVCVVNADAHAVTRYCVGMDIADRSCVSDGGNVNQHNDTSLHVTGTGCELLTAVVGVTVDIDKCLPGNCR